MPNTCNYPGCPEPAETDRRQCQHHLKQARQGQREHAAKRYDAGLCKLGPDHPRLPDSPFCQMHRDAARQYLRDWRVRRFGPAQSRCGLCVRLCGRMQIPRRKLCAVCAQETKEERQAELRARGLCMLCHTKPADPGTQRCAPCSMKKAKYMRERRQRLLASGLCETGCGKAATPGRGCLCAACAEKHNKVRRKNPAPKP